MNYPYVQIAVPSPLRRFFDYLMPAHATGLKPGMRVKVPFGSRQVVGIVMGVTARTEVPSNRLKHVSEVIDQEPIFDEALLSLIQFASQYYHHPIGEVFHAAMPKLLRQGRPLVALDNSVLSIQQSQPKELTPNQSAALEALLEHKEGYHAFLLEGVTGSGKTEVYLRLIEERLRLGKQALVLVPEIGLTPQTVARFQERFSVPVVMLHSNLTDKQRLVSWTLAHNHQASIIIGTRSAVFTSLPDLGVIIVDEEHDLSFKQQDRFRYSARDLAVYRAQLEKIPIVLGSATPSLETLNNVNLGRYQHLQLTERPGAVKMPSIHVLDLRRKKLIDGLSPELIGHIKKHLEEHHQVLLFLNRRGFAPILICHGCGWIASCLRCDARMTLHQRPRQLHCHHCGGTSRVPELCPQCSCYELVPMGAGTERLEQTMAQYFPDTPVLRVDRDSTRRKGSMEKLLDEIQTGNPAILIGTQMLAKGHHFPNVTLVAILEADYGLFGADFRATERMGQLLLQVAGRAGRAEHDGQVLIQSYQPEHPLLKLLTEKGYEAFAQQLLGERRITGLPPHASLMLLRADSLKQDDPMIFLNEVLCEMEPLLTSEVGLIGPVPLPMERRAGRYRAQFLLQSQKRSVLQVLMKNLLPLIESLRLARQVKWVLDVDPQELF